MSDAAESPRPTAGAMLRAAREKQGLHIAALAAAIKVAPRKLDALENDRYAELPDATFTRALAQTVCRSLKIDAQPVLALLPPAEPAVLDHAASSLNAPFRGRAGGDEASGIAVAAIRPMVWAGVALLVAAGVVYFLPSGWSLPWSTEPAASAPTVAARPAPAPAPAEAASAVAAPASSAAVDVPAAQAPASAAAPAAAAEQAPPVASALPGAVQLRAAAESWVEARDADGRVLLSRTMQAGESAGFDGALPIRLTIGNAPATSLSFRGKAVDLAPVTRDNVARLQLK